jgi:hypothetical protein
MKELQDSKLMHRVVKAFKNSVFIYSITMQDRLVHVEDVATSHFLCVRQTITRTPSRLNISLAFT